MRQIIITLTSIDGTVTRSVVVKPEGKPVQLQVPEGTRVDVQVQGSAHGKPAERLNTKHDLQLKQVGKDLVIEGEGEKLVEVTDFYATSNVSVGSVGWDYAEPVATDLSAATLEGKSAAQAGEAMASAATGDFSMGYSMPVVLGAAAVGVAALAGGSGASAASAAPTVVTGVFTAGPAVNGNDLAVQLYTANKTKLGDPVLLDGNGKFSVNIGNYTGVVFVQLVNKGAQADYRDEGTGLTLDLTADLLAMGTVGAGTNTININPLTTMSAKLVGVTSNGGVLSGSYDAAKAATANEDIAEAFGLTGDVTKLDSIPVIDADGNANPSASDLGKVLAALSGWSMKNGGLQSTLDRYVPTAGQGISTSVNPLKDLIEGALAAQEALGSAGNNLVKSVAAVMTHSTATAGYGIDAIAIDDVIDAVESLAFTAGTTSFTFQVPAGTLPADLKISIDGGAVGAVAFTVSGTTATYVIDTTDVGTLQGLAEGGHKIQLTAKGVVVAEHLFVVDRVDDTPPHITTMSFKSVTSDANDTLVQQMMADQQFKVL